MPAPNLTTYGKQCEWLHAYWTSLATLLVVHSGKCTHVAIPVTGDIEKAFLQISLKEEDRDAFRFLFNVNDKEQHFRFTRVPFGAEASPFMLAATLQLHYDCQPEELSKTVKVLRENTCVDNFMKTRHEVKDLEKFKEEATQILGNAQFPVQKWESNVTALESDNMPTTGKILSK